MVFPEWAETYLRLECTLPMEALKSKEEAAAALKSFAHQSALLGALMSARDKARLAVEKKHQPGIKAVADELAARRAQLEDWARANRELIFGAEQSVEFSYGWLKFRMGARKLVTLAKWTEEKVLQALLAFPVTSQWHEYIRNTPSINKQKLLEATKDGGKLPEAKLRDIGCRVVREESFSIETKPDMVAADCDLIP